MQRREFIVALAGAVATASTLRLRAESGQQAEKVRRVSVLMGLSDSNPKFRAFVAAFVEELARLGWVDGRNVRIEQQWTNADIKRTSDLAAELVGSQPDVILCSTTPVTAALHRATSTIPIVFAIVSDPVGAGFVAGLPRPGGNITGFTNAEAAVGGKWLSLLKEVAPGIRRAGIMFNPDTAPGGGKYHLDPFAAAARSLGVEPVAMRVRSDAEIETVIAALGSEQAGLVLLDDSFMAVHYRRSFPRRLTKCRRSTWRPNLSGTAGSSHTGRTSRICSAVRPAMSIAFCAVRNRPTCRYRRRRNSRLRSTSRQPRHSASMSRLGCSPPPTR